MGVLREVGDCENTKPFFLSSLENPRKQEDDGDFKTRSICHYGLFLLPFYVLALSIDV